MKSIFTATLVIFLNNYFLALMLYIFRMFTWPPTADIGVFSQNFIHSTSFTPLGSRWVSKKAENFNKLGFLCLGCCFSVRIEKSSRTSKSEPKNMRKTPFLGSIFNLGLTPSLRTLARYYSKSIFIIQICQALNVLIL